MFCVGHGGDIDKTIAANTATACKRTKQGESSPAASFCGSSLRSLFLSQHTTHPIRSVFNTILLHLDCNYDTHRIHQPLLQIRLQLQSYLNSQCCPSSLSLEHTTLIINQHRTTPWHVSNWPRPLSFPSASPPHGKHAPRLYPRQSNSLPSKLMPSTAKMP